jgi:cytochrome b561
MDIGMDINIKFLFWFFVIALIVNRLILRFYYKPKFVEVRKEWYESAETYYLGFFHATLMALIAVSFILNYPKGLYG